MAIEKYAPVHFGIFGGLFDPPHIGHLIIAQWVLEEFNLNKIIFVPTFNPPHKVECVPFKHRYEMAKLAIKENKKFLISDIERRIRGKSFTIEVLRKLKKSDKELRAARVYFIIGADQWEEIEHWHKPEEIFKECRIIVVKRPGYKLKRIKPYYNNILISNSPLIEISSTTIRKRAECGLNIRYFVVPRVFNYIKRFKLYRGMKE